MKPRGADRLAATLRERLADALLYRKLATLVSDVPLKEKLADLEFGGVPRARFEKFCDKLELATARARPKRWAL